MLKTERRGKPHRKWQPRGTRSVRWQLFSYAVLLAAAVFVLAPLWHIAVLSLEPLAPAREMAAWRLPHQTSFANFTALVASTGFLRWTFHSLIVALAVTASGVLLSATAGYALSRFKFFGRLAVLQTLLITQIFPATMLLLPIFLILGHLELINTFIGLTLVYLATVLPFCIWQMKNFYDGFPENVEEAAAMDGCTPAEIFRLVVMPASGPGLVVTALFSFAAVWNEYVVAAIILQHSSAFTLPLGLRSLHADNGGLPPGLFAAGAVLVSVPMLALYLMLSRFLVSRVQDIRLRN